LDVGVSEDNNIYYPEGNHQGDAPDNPRPALASAGVERMQAAVGKSSRVTGTCHREKTPLPMRINWPEATGLSVVGCSPVARHSSPSVSTVLQARAMEPRKRAHQELVENDEVASAAGGEEGKRASASTISASAPDRDGKHASLPTLPGEMKMKMMKVSLKKTCDFCVKRKRSCSGLGLRRCR